MSRESAGEAVAASDIIRFRNAIASIESAGSGGYSALGPRTGGDRAYGRYQVMGRNIPAWSARALGRSVTPEQFLANPAIQDAVFDTVFGGYIGKYGPQGAAQAWFGGPGSVGQTGRRDVLGTSVGGYGQKFMRAMGNAPAAPPMKPAASPQEAVDQAPYHPPMTPPMLPQPAPQQRLAQQDWMQNRSYSADALLADFFAGRNPLRRLMYQKIAGLFA